MSSVREAANDYLRMRRALGFKLESQGQLLERFVSYLEQAGGGTVTTELALAWATQPAHADPVWWSKRLSVVRGFARHLQTLDPAAEVPSAQLLPYRRRRAIPYLYSPSEIVALMDAAEELASPLRTATYRTLIGLLAVTGMRVGEAIRLNRADVDWDKGLLTILSTKFGKDREVPLDPSAVRALAAYDRRRDQLCPQPTAPAFFVSTAGTRLHAANVRRTFTGLLQAAGLGRRSPRRRQRLHDLRHSFAIWTLLDWYRSGADVQARLPLLSSYVGHVEPSSTYWYLSAAPELLELAAQRLERAEGAAR
ncbi:MAG: tyrosine-type recombinase/integrase [Solirubrobacteraceae bacterium]